MNQSSHDPARTQQDIIIRQASGAQLREWQRFRGWTIRILEELQNSGGLTYAELCDRTHCRRNDLRLYCSRLFSAGCISPVEKWGWNITSVGTFVLLLQLGNTSATQQQHKRNTSATLRQLTLAPYNGIEFTDAELAVTNLLISHWQATKEKFVYVNDFADISERLQIPPDILRQALQHLRQDGVCYLWWDRQYEKYQLRIKPAFLERMQHA